MLRPEVGFCVGMRRRLVALQRDLPAAYSVALSRRTREGRCDQGSRLHDHDYPIRARTEPVVPGLDALMSERRQLINIACRLLGSLAAARDANQEIYARWVIGYHIPWTYALCRLNPDQTSGQERGASANGNGFRDRACSW